MRPSLASRWTWATWAASHRRGRAGRRPVRRPVQQRRRVAESPGHEAAILRSTSSPSGRSRGPCCRSSRPVPRSSTWPRAPVRAGATTSNRSSAWRRSTPRRGGLRARGAHRRRARLQPVEGSADRLDRGRVRGDDGARPAHQRGLPGRGGHRAAYRLCRRLRRGDGPQRRTRRPTRSAGRDGRGRRLPAGAHSSWLRGAEISPDGGMGAFAASDALGLATLRL
jgi:hypothetical protein